MAIPYTFGNLPNGTAIPLSYLDANFSYLSASPSFSGNVSVGGTLSVTGSATFSNTVSVTGSAALGGTLSVTGSATFSSTVSVTGSAALGGTLSVTGHVTLEGVTSTGATGTGNLVFATSPTLVTPLLGTPTSGTLTNCTGLPVSTGIGGLGAGVATALGTAVNGSGAISLTTSPAFVTPSLGVASATSVNKVTITAPSTGASLTIADGKTLTASNTLTFTGTDASSVAFGSGGTVAYTADKLSSFATTTSAELAGVISDETGSGALVFGTGPTITSATLVTPTLGTPSGGTLTNCSGLPLTTGVTGVLPEANGGTGRTTLSFPNVTGTVITSADSGTVTPTMLSQKLTVMPSQATTSGSTKDFTSIPSWVRKITVVLNGVSHSSGTNQSIGIQLGTSGGVVTSGYASGGAYTGTAATGVNASTYFTTGGSLNSSDILHGIMTIANITSNTWVASFAGGLSNDTYGYLGGGSIALSGTLDRVRVLTSAGGTFDAGAVTVIYE